MRVSTLLTRFSAAPGPRPSGAGGSDVRSSILQMGPDNIVLGVQSDIGMLHGLSVALRTASRSLVRMHFNDFDTLEELQAADFATIDFGNFDFDVQDFAVLLQLLPEDVVITASLSPLVPQQGDPTSWYVTQRECLVDWFYSQTTKGSGEYSREEPNRSAKRTYNRLQSLHGVAWVAEAVGVDRDVFFRGWRAANKVEDHRRQCGVFRTEIPWAIISRAMLEFYRDNYEAIHYQLAEWDEEAAAYGDGNTNQDG
ncbi:hypothetical protein KRX51_09655 [Corynebacterium sp. TAE3-ERU12]|uniref:hypothetical protein n=1 Tax=Corynebacterium sp. TAE3-ERU12 TaxID=2849491 RepID=UPI001C45D9F7|nr:hypothetical protein [Corynebacterium sp. TAE3-ERU12]MBV7296174.1 hypothetical protein [Corynebacterium sp. TAE3-ERU12]